MSTLKSDSSGKSSESVGSYSFIHDHKPRSGNCSCPDFVPDAKWWLNHYGLETGYSLDQLNVLDTDTKSTVTYGDSKLIEGYCHPHPKNDPAFPSEPLKHLVSDRKSNDGGWLLGFESAVDNSDLLPNAHLKGLDSCNGVLLEQPEKLYTYSDSHWIGVEKIEPWWHAVDKDEIAASLTSQTSSHHKKNCDHAGIQSMHAEKVSENRDRYEEKLIEETKSLCKVGQPEPLLQESDQNCSKECNNAAEVDSSHTHVANGGLNRAQLLEALCHSQTRAREAEKLAQEACDDKDYVMNLFFQQASCLFAYRQWLHMLQLETLCLQLRSKDGIKSLASPSMLPWERSKGVSLRKSRSRAGNKQRFNASKCALAIALGLGLAGAGLLVGWTVGWLFPAF